MNLFKYLTVAAVAVSSSVLFGAEVIDLTAKDFWRPNKKITFSEGKIVADGRVMLVSKKLFKIDPAKKYTFKMDIVAPGATKSSYTLFGMYPATAKGAHLSANRLQTQPGSFTQVVEAAQKGATQIKIKDGSKWNAKSTSSVVALNAKADNSDLPNSNIAGSIKSIKKEGNVWIVTFRSPLRRDIAANTNIRQHYDGGYFYFGSRMVGAKNIAITSTITGKASQGIFSASRGFHPAMTHAYLTILIDWNNTKNKVEFKNATLTIE